ncbi:MAG: AAA domain-containing protein [Oligoflexia bacterium]|nr:AAA domain-containing protein [Oligoflexia bacterium]
MSTVLANLCATRPSFVDDPLRTLGLHGLSAIATPVLAGLVTGDPVLLVGSHGTAKTALVAALAAALGLRFRAYDASKALFEDIVGFPDPSGLAEGKVRYVPTEVSIWGTELVLVDELSRASPAMQNKWLEVVRGRQVMGVPVTSLRHVFAAMNPPGYLGARPLDPALIGRFGFIVQVPGVDKMSPGEVERVIRTVGEVDAPACRSVWPRAPLATDGQEIRQLVDDARQGMRTVLDDLESPLVVYVREVAARLRGDGVALDGRRMALCFRGLVAALAVEAARGRTVPDERQVHDVLVHSLPGVALDRPEPSHAVFAAHVHAWEVAFGRHEGDASLLARERQVVRVLGQVEPLAMVDAYAESLHLLSEEEHHEVASRVFRHLRSGGGALPRGSGAATAELGPPRALAALRRLLQVVVSHADVVPLDVVGRVMVGWQALTGLSSGTWDELHDLVTAADDAVPEPPYSDDDWLACRVAIELSRDEPGDPNEHSDCNRSIKLREPLRDALRAHAPRAHAPRSQTLELSSKG